jgi:hypothetical protein
MERFDRARVIPTVAVLALAVVVLLTSSPASAETLCVRGAVYIEAGIIVPPSDIVKRDVESFMDCPLGSNSYVQHPERQELTSSEIKRIREAKRKAEEKE